MEDPEMEEQNSEDKNGDIILLKVKDRIPSVHDE